MNRRKFIYLGAAGAASLSIPVKVLAQLHEKCEPTTEDILGPFYRPSAPFRNDFRLGEEAQPPARGDADASPSPNPEGAAFDVPLAGQKLRISGAVRHCDCAGKGIPGAILDVWHCDSAGVYDNETESFLYRGRLRTNDEGAYTLKTIIPGRYRNGPQYRPAHIHFLLSVPEYEPLVSQLYFKGDPYIERDPWASDPAASERILNLTKNEEEWEVNADIILDPIETERTKQQ